MVPKTVRVIYIVPNDEQAWPDAKLRSTQVLEDLQHFFADEMNRLVHESITFEIARDGKGDTLFEVKRSTLEKAAFQAQPIEACQQVLCGGRPPDAPDIEVCFFEGYSIEKGVASVPGAKTKRRRCYLNSLYLKTANRDWLHDLGGYAGRLFPWISFEPMLGTTLQWNKDQGLQLGDVAGSAYGIIAHELGHAFGGKHHSSEDDERERKGHLMGLGSRGFRGYFRPDLTDDRCVLSQETASTLKESPFFECRHLKPKGSHFSERLRKGLKHGRS